MKPCLVFLLSIGAFAQQPHFLNARVEAVARSGALNAQTRQIAASGEALWIGYSVPRVAGAGQNCCYWNDGFSSSRGCGLEPNTPRPSAEAARPVLLEGERQTTVLLRFESGALIRVRGFSLDCELDAGGLRVAWINGVSGAESIAYLMGLEEQFRRQALGVIATLADPQATKILEEAATDGETESMRRSAISMLGSMRGSSGYDALMRLMSRNGDTRIRAVEALGSNVDPRALATLRSATKDADAAVRKRSVSALSRLPNNAGVAALIELARDRNTEPALRKEAVNGLGRVRDPKAQAYLEQLLR